MAKVLPETIKEAVAELGINRPIRDVRVVGNKIELHTAHKVYEWPARPRALKYCSMKELREIARTEGLRIPSSARKGAVIRAIEVWRERNAREMEIPGVIR